MVDVVLLANVMLLAALAAAATMLLAARGSPRSWRRDGCWSWAIGAGLLATSGAFDPWPHWPPLEDRARFLTLLLPLALLVETWATTLRSSKAAWTLRAALAAAVTPILLHDTVYLSDLDARGSAAWSTVESAIALCGVAVLLTIVWWTWSKLESHISTPAVQGMLAIDAAASAVTVMLSGYYRAGLLGLALAAAIGGATVASYVAQPRPTTHGSVGMSVIGIFTLVIMGRFFGALATGLAAGLLLAPLVVWVVELPGLRALAPRWRAAARLVLVAAPLVIVLLVAQRRFVETSSSRARPAASTAVGETSR
jgi:hypothetical protein